MQVLVLVPDMLADGEADGPGLPLMVSYSRNDEVKKRMPIRGINTMSASSRKHRKMPVKGISIQSASSRKCLSAAAENVQ